VKNSAVGYEWQDVRKNIFTPEEISASDLRVALIGELIKARQDKGITQKQLELLSGVKQPVIARMENGTSIPKISTILKILADLSYCTVRKIIRGNTDGY
jgi:ribosome-binding protein aMBF1 (putative translation factor)